VPRASVVTTQLRSRNELFQTMVAEMMSLVPGSLVVDLDPGTGRVSMHVLDVETATEAEAFRRRVLDQERRVLAALSASTDDRPVRGRR
jgi:multicomponent Na+:H+ antiporter subunit E